MRRYRLILPILVLALLGAAIPAALQARSAGTIAVTAGVPKELAFKVSPKKITASPAVFHVTNRGKQPHSFKLCTKPSATDTADTCKGVATKLLAPGASQMLTVKLTESGTYEYLSGTASQARAGMKGLLTVSLAAPTSGSGGGTTTTPASSGVGTTTTTPKSSTGSGSSGGVVNGQATDPACAAGTAIPVGPGAGDQDDDNEGGFPTDGDGCL